jgi:oligoendopeptidase F
MQKNGGVKWNLDDVCRMEDFDKLFSEIEKELEVTEKWWAKLNPEMPIEIFREFLDYDEKLSEKFSRLSHLPSLLMSIDQKDAKARLMGTRVDDLSLKFSQKNRKMGHWLKGLMVEGKKTLDDDNAKRLFRAIPDLEYGLNYSREAAKHTLGQKEEEIIENKDVNGVGAISDLRGLIEADLVYEMGKKKINNQAELMKYVYSKKTWEREGAYRALFNKHKENIDKFFVIYQAVVKDWGFEAKLRGYKSPITVRNFANHVSDKAVETLLRVCREERKVFWKYFEYKAKQLHKKKLSRFDVYAPISLKVNKVEKLIKFEEAKKMVLESFEKFSQRFAKMAKMVIDEQHIDSHPDKAKRSGAFCATVGPKITPYVMLNHTNTLRDVSTLAHELGHAVHSLYANKHYSSAQHANLPLAETASTLGEMILFENMLTKEKDREIKRQMLSEKIGDSYATILRQNYFVLFEIEAHELIAKGTTAEELSEVYLKNLKDQFGSSMKIDPIFKYEWLYISHIFESPFYCYAYNFGELLSLSLYARYKVEGEKFVSRIERILETGGSKNPKEILDEVGVDVEDENFWRGGFRIIEGWQILLESI